jgi:hypothetical protein
MLEVFKFYRSRQIHSDGPGSSAIIQQQVVSRSRFIVFKKVDPGCQVTQTPFRVKENNRLITTNSTCQVVD